MRPVALTFPAAAAASIAALQTTAGAGSLVLNGTGVVTTCPFNGSSVAYFPGFQVVVTLTSTGNISGVNFTISGLDSNLNAVSQTIAGPNNNTVATTQEFMVVTGITVNGAVGTNTSAGNGTTGHSQWVVPDRRAVPFQLGLAGEITAGAVTYSFQHALDDPKGSTADPPTGTVAFPDPLFNAVTVSQFGSLNTPVRATRAIVSASSGGGAVVFNFVPNGPG